MRSSRILLLAILAVALLGVFTPQIAHADTILTYTGQNYSTVNTGTFLPPPGCTGCGFNTPYSPQFTTQMRLTMQIVLSVPLPSDGVFNIGQNGFFPLPPPSYLQSWTLNDGWHDVVNPFSSFPNSVVSLSLSMSGGAISHWDLSIRDPRDPDIGVYRENFFSTDISGDRAERLDRTHRTCLDFGGGDCFWYWYDYASVAAPGSWTVQTTVPEPGS